MKMLVAAILMITLIACTPTGQDNTNYAQLEAMLPDEFAKAPVVFSWRGFTAESDGDTTRQCAILIYDASKAPINQFMSRTQKIQDAPEETLKAYDWQIVGKRETRIQMPTGIHYEVPFRDANAFCHMPEGRFASFAYDVSRLWEEEGARVLVRSIHYGGGVALSAQPADNHLFAAFDPTTKRLYMWLQAYPNSN